MGFRDRLKEGAEKAAKMASETAERATEEARKAAAGESTGLIGSAIEGARTSSAGGAIANAFVGLREFAKANSDEISVELYLERLVAAVRKDDVADDRSARDVYLDAKRRRRKLGLASIGTGPFSGVTSQAVDLYCEVAILVDLVDVHRLELTNRDVAAHALLMWDFAESFEVASNAMDGNPPVADLLARRLGSAAGDRMPEKMSTRGVSSAIWKARSDISAIRKSTTTGAVKGAVFTGRSTKNAIKKLDEQLTVSGHKPA
jgi:hypothetical protein